MNKLYKYYNKYPWRRTLVNIKTRCTNKRTKCYKNYGGRGIKCLITVEELKKLWFRDKTYAMKRPSIDRKDNDGNYTYGNCEYIEKGLNTAKRNKRISKKPILQFDLNGKFIRKYLSLTEAAKITQLDLSSINKNALGKIKNPYKFIWKYKKEKKRA